MSNEYFYKGEIGSSFTDQAFCSDKFIGNGNLWNGSKCVGNYTIVKLNPRVNLDEAINVSKTIPVVEVQKVQQHRR